MKGIYWKGIKQRIGKFLDKVYDCILIFTDWLGVGSRSNDYGLLVCRKMVAYAYNLFNTLSTSLTLFLRDVL